MADLLLRIEEHMRGEKKSKKSTVSSFLSLKTENPTPEFCDCRWMDKTIINVKCPLFFLGLVDVSVELHLVDRFRNQTLCDSRRRHLC